MRETQRFSYNGKVYSTRTLDELSLNDLILFEEETADAGTPLTLIEAEKINPNSAMAIAIGVWATLCSAGDKITFAQARQIRMKDLKAVTAPADHRKASPKATRQNKPPSRSTASGAGEGAQAASQVTTRSDAG